MRLSLTAWVRVRVRFRVRIRVGLELDPGGNGRMTGCKCPGG